MRRLILASLVVVVGCETGQVKKQVERLHAENADLKGEIEASRRKNALLRAETAARDAAAEDAKAIVEEATEGLRRELREIRDALAAVERPDAAGLLVDPEIEERLFEKVEQIKEAVWESSPSGCVRILGAVIESYPNTRAALRAEGILAEWEARGVMVTDENAAEIDDRIRGLLHARSRTWREIQEAMRAAEAGEVEEAVRTLREIAGRDEGDQPERQALEILENWGVARLDPAEIDFAALAPKIKREAAAQRQIEAAFRSLHRGRVEVALRAFRKIVKRYPDARGAERAREGLEDAEAELRERREERERGREEGREEERGERRRGERRQPREREAPEREAPEREEEGREREGQEVEERRGRERRRGERRDGDRRDGERRDGERRDGERRDGERRDDDRPRDDREGEEERAGDEGEKRDGVPLF